MGRLGSTTSPRARQMRRVLARWERSELTLREFGRRHRIAPSTLTWWRHVFRRAGKGVTKVPTRVAARNAVAFTEVLRPATGPTPPPVLEIVLRNGHVVRVPAGADADTLRQVLQAVQTTC